MKKIILSAFIAAGMAGRLCTTPPPARDDSVLDCWVVDMKEGQRHPYPMVAAE